MCYYDWNIWYFIFFCWCCCHCHFSLSEFFVCFPNTFFFLFQSHYSLYIGGLPFIRVFFFFFLRCMIRCWHDTRSQKSWSLSFFVSPFLAKHIAKGLAGLLKDKSNSIYWKCYESDRKSAFTNCPINESRYTLCKQMRWMCKAKTNYTAYRFMYISQKFRLKLEIFEMPLIWPE